VPRKEEGPKGGRNEGLVERERGVGKEGVGKKWRGGEKERGWLLIV